ncbi:tetratricopeptide repeat protein [Gracilibacillus sp. D59]|uniref:tetratricopeptide repeat protein n=1 Tax=Gracilibacillus sp. D59 TaxID=3457434 RepID=UPI003FCE211C
MSDDKHDRERKLMDLLLRIKKAPFYKRKLADYNLMNIGLEKISKLPFTVNAELRKAEAFDHLAVEHKEAIHYCESVDTTEKKTSTWLTQKDLETGIRQIKGCGLDKEDIVLFRFPEEFTTTSFHMEQACLEVGATIIPAHRMVMSYPKLLSLMDRLSVTVIVGSPREIERMTETIRLLGLDKGEHFPSLRAIIVTGEVMSDRRKEHLERKWDVPLFNIYSTNETGNIAAMCEHGAMHIFEQDVVVEAWKEDGSGPVDQGDRGLAVITTLSSQASPLLRYLNEDVISFEQGLCPCGKTEKKLVCYGQLQQRTRFKGIVLDEKDIQDAIYSLDPVPAAWKVIQQKNGLHIMLDSEQYDERSLEEIEGKLSKMLKVAVTVEIGYGTLLNRNELLQDIVPKRQEYIGNEGSEDPNVSSSILLRDLLDRGYSAFRINEYEKAHRLFEEAISLVPHSAEAHAWLAAVYGRQIDTAWSLTDKIDLFNKLENEITVALEIDPTLPLARRMNGSKLLNTPDMLGGDPAEAAKEFRYCIEQGMNDIEIWVSLAKCYMETADLAKAREALKEALAIEPKNEEALQLLQDAMNK